MADRNKVYLVTINTRPIAAFTVRQEAIRWLGLEWPKPPTNLRVFKMLDGVRAEVKDITATLYGLAD